MKVIRSLGVLFLLAASQAVFGYGMGYSSHPLNFNNKLITSEATGIVNEGGGVGLQARYTHKITKKFIADAGLGFGSGERNLRAFVGADFEIFPDYMRQPRISAKVQFERAKEFDETHNILSFAPTVSKGFSFWGKEGFPFFALPVGLSLQPDSSTYKTSIAAAIGITGQVPIEGYDHLMANLELDVSLKDAPTSIILGITFPL